MYDLTVIGAGPGGYAAAVKAAELGAKVCIVEKDSLGGVCLNKGCIPTKVIIKSADTLEEIRRSSEFGIDTDGYHIDLKKINERKNEVVLRLRQGMETLLKVKGIDVIKGEASLRAADRIEVDSKTINSRYIIIATGAVPMEQEGLKIDHHHILSSDDALQLDRIAKDIIIIGAGAIGCEFASIYHSLGSRVTIIELLDQLLPDEDKEIAGRLEVNFKKSGINVIKNSKVVSVEAKNGVTPVRNLGSEGGNEISNGVRVNLETQGTVEAEAALLCIGRRANLSGLHPDKIGLRTDNGRIWVDGNLKTNIPNIYAVGDVTGRYFLANVASYEGAVAAESIFGTAHPADYSGIPVCIFTRPQISRIGLTEEKARGLGLEFLVTRIPFAAISKAHILGETEGLVKLISDAQTDQVLGTHLFGPSATELISEFAIAMKGRMTIKKLTEVVYPHPTLSEGVLEVARRIKK